MKSGIYPTVTAQGWAVGVCLRGPLPACSRTTQQKSIGHRCAVSRETVSLMLLPETMTDGGRARLESCFPQADPCLTMSAPGVPASSPRGHSWDDPEP